MIVRVSAEAEAEIKSAQRYFNNQSRGLGGRFVKEFGEALEAIATRPGSFGKLETLPADQPYRRALLPTFPYAVVFEMLEIEIVVIAVAHSSRQPNYWLGRPL